MQLMLISVIASYMCFVRGQQQCRTASGGSGSCISLYDCSPLLSIVNKPNRSQQDVDTLRKSQCGFQGQTPMVCCPSAPPPAPPSANACFTPNAMEGKCVGLYSCPQLANMLKPPVAPDTVAFVASSRCEGSEQYSVCCPNPGQSPVKGACAPSVAPPDQKSGCCGMEIGAADKITAGNDTAIDQYPWMALIEYTKSSKIKLLCGGALISAKYVITAGHCVAGPVLDSGTPRNVRLGEYDTTNEVAAQDCVMVSGGGRDCNDGATVIPIEKTIPHPQYNPNHSLRRHDIALVRLRSLAPYTDFIRPICLPLMDATAAVPADFKLYVAGWGAVNSTHSKSNIKQHVDVAYKNHEQCQPAYTAKNRNVALWKGQVCAGGEDGKDSCKGDSGGPLMYERGKTFELIGIVSFGPTPCGIDGIPGVYTKVYEYIPWIRSNVKP